MYIMYYCAYNISKCNKMAIQIYKNKSRETNDKT